MKTTKWVALVMVCFATLLVGRSALAQFGKHDYVAILVEGDDLKCDQWGLSGKGSIYRAAGKPASESVGPMFFQKVADQVPLERRSSKALKCGIIDYSSGGAVPPGVYGVFYRRFDNKRFPGIEGRHRLGMQDGPCNLPRKCTQNIASPSGGIREAIQFHIAYNNLAEYKAEVNEGCVVMTALNWQKLFPASMTDPASSPLVAFDGTTEFAGGGRVLAFVTDVTDTKVQKRQIDAFQKAMTTGLKAQYFEDAATTQQLSALWRAGKDF